MLAKEAENIKEGGKRSIFIHAS